MPRAERLYVVVDGAEWSSHAALSTSSIATPRALKVATVEPSWRLSVNRSAPSSTQ
jgi:hypothetical protein